MTHTSEHQRGCPSPGSPLSTGYALVLDIEFGSPELTAFYQQCMTRYIRAYMT